MDYGELILFCDMFLLYNANNFNGFFKSVY
jgi:hypothetical protein